jgi:uncharacterized protein
MPSVVKILIIVAVVWFVWRGFNRIVAAGQAARNQHRGSGDARPNRPTAAQRPIEDMVKCPKCGAYVAGLANHRCEG